MMLAVLEQLSKEANTEPMAPQPIRDILTDLTSQSMEYFTDNIWSFKPQYEKPAPKKNWVWELTVAEGVELKFLKALRSLAYGYRGHNPLYRHHAAAGRIPNPVACTRGPPRADPQPT